MDSTKLVHLLLNRSNRRSAVQWDTSEHYLIMSWTNFRTAYLGSYAILVVVSHRTSLNQLALFQRCIVTLWQNLFDIFSSETFSTVAAASLFLKMGQSRPLLVYLRFFHIIPFNNWLKHGWCAWDSNWERHDGRRRRIHWAMVL